MNTAGQMAGTYVAVGIGAFVGDMVAGPPEGVAGGLALPVVTDFMGLTRGAGDVAQELMRPQQPAPRPDSVTTLVIL